jgi:hypothetical protein
LPIVIYLPFLRFVEAVYAVEKSGLAGTVRSDNSQYLVISDIKAHLSKSSDTAKAKGKVLNPQSNLFIGLYRHALFLSMP